MRNWLNNLFPAAPPRRRPHRRVPRLEHLEDRLAPAVITVSSFADSASPGSGSLRAAITAANNGDTIVLPAGTYRITLPGAGEDANATGDFDISKSITIKGAAGTTPGQVVVDGNYLDRVFDVIGAVNVTFQGLTITGGNVAGPGGGVAASIGGSITLSNDIVTFNQATGSGGSGGGIYAAGGGSITIQNGTQVTNNQGSIFGGGVCLDRLGDSLTVYNSTISGNSAPSAGGGIFVGNGIIGAATIVESTISGNFLTATYLGGGGLYFALVNNTVTLSGDTISGNFSGLGGGGIDYFSGRELDIISSTISGNRAATGFGGGIFDEGNGAVAVATSIISNNIAAAGPGGAISATGGNFLNLIADQISGNQAGNAGGALYLTGTTFHIFQTTISGNRSGAGALGGAGIYFSSNGPNNFITDSTLAGNVSPSDAGAILQGGGGGDLTLLNDTVAFNHASGNGGGLWKASGAVLTLTNTIVANNTSGTNDPNMFCGVVTAIASGGGNVVGTTPGAASFAAVASDQQSTDPLLGGLADNGGDATVTLPDGTHPLTFALPANSPAVDRALTAKAPGVDQRNFSRPQGAAADAGAYERAVPFTSVSVAFGPAGQVVEVVDSAGNLTQFDAAGTHYIGGGVRSASVAFYANSEVLLVTYQNGVLYQFDAGGAHLLAGGGIRSASLAFGPGGAAYELVDTSGNLTQFDAGGAHFIGGGFQSASLAFGPSGAVLLVVDTSGNLTQFDSTGAHSFGGGVLSAGVAFDASGAEVADVIFQNKQLFQFDSAGTHLLRQVS
jgi:hypothetical protein